MVSCAGFEAGQPVTEVPAENFILAQFQGFSIGVGRLGVPVQPREQTARAACNG